MNSVDHVCRCCRGAVNDKRRDVLCAVCSPWNRIADLLANSKPSWQAFLEEERDELLNEVGVWLTENRSIQRMMPYNDGWRMLLGKLTGVESFSDDSRKLERHRDYPQFQKVRDLLAGRGSRLFPDAVGGVDSDSEMTVRFNGHTVTTSGDFLIVDGAKVDHGPGSLLFAMMAERSIHSPVLRFLRVLNQIEGGEMRESQKTNSTLRYPLLRWGFTPIGTVDTPFQASPASTAPLPPLCDWNEETFQLGVEAGIKGRKVLQLPSEPALLEQFLSVWYGRMSIAASDRLRAASLQLARRLGTEAKDARITPLERSFSLLRSTVEGNPSRLRATHTALFISGGSGVSWRMKPGRGAHGAPYLIQTVVKDGICLGTPICLYDNSELPLGDRLNSVVLSLLNDNILSSKLVQIDEALKENRHITQNLLTRG